MKLISKNVVSVEILVNHNLKETNDPKAEEVKKLLKQNRKSCLVFKRYERIEVELNCLKKMKADKTEHEFIQFYEEFYKPIID